MNLAAIQNQYPGIRKQAKAFRLVNQKRSAEMDEIGHTMINGWRYNPKNEFGVLYLSLSAECCLKEKIKQAGDRKSLKPQALGVFEVDLQHCLDLTDEKVLAALEIDVRKLTIPTDFTEPQTISREARRVGFDGLIVQSAIGAECINLVIFKDKISRKSFCELKEIKPYKI